MLKELAFFFPSVYVTNNLKELFFSNYDKHFKMPHE